MRHGQEQKRGTYSSIFSYVNLEKDQVISDAYKIKLYPRISYFILNARTPGNIDSNFEVVRRRLYCWTHARTHRTSASFMLTFSSSSSSSASPVARPCSSSSRMPWSLRVRMTESPASKDSTPCVTCIARRTDQMVRSPFEEVYIFRGGHIPDTMICRSARAGHWHSSTGTARTGNSNPLIGLSSIFARAFYLAVRPRNTPYYTTNSVSGGKRRDSVLLQSGILVDDNIISLLIESVSARPKDLHEIRRVCQTAYSVGPPI